MKFIATALAAFMLTVSFAGTAEANRPVPGYQYKDVCKNIPGKQTVHDVTGISARYRWDDSTPRKNDCVRVNRSKG